MENYGKIRNANGLAWWRTRSTFLTCELRQWSGLSTLQMVQWVELPKAEWFLLQLSAGLHGKLRFTFRLLPRVIW